MGSCCCLRIVRGWCFSACVWVWFDCCLVCEVALLWLALAGNCGWYDMCFLGLAVLLRYDGVGRVFGWMWRFRVLLRCGRL